MSDAQGLSRCILRQELIEYLIQSAPVSILGELGSEIEFAVAEHQVKGCGGNTFKGQFEESQVEGKLFFQKKFHDVVLKKL